MYRGVNGRKCAIGWLINDEQYDPCIEGSDIDHLPVRQLVEASLDGKLTDDERYALKEMQMIHDDYSVETDVPWMEYIFDKFSIEFGLEHDGS
jgi:hypothetical protein